MSTIKIIYLGKGIFKIPFLIKGPGNKVSGTNFLYLTNLIKKGDVYFIGKVLIKENNF